VFGERAPLGEKVRGHRTHFEPEQVFHLARENDHGDSAREPGDDGVWNELDDSAELRGAEDDEEHTGHDRGDEESVDPILLDDAVHDHDERARRSADLHARAAERRNQEPGDDGGPQAAIWRDSAGDREGNRQRQGNDSDDDSGRDVGHELGAVIGLQRRD
jgi:hypothetical protein